jgi:hypothetical protein
VPISWEYSDRSEELRAEITSYVFEPTIAELSERCSCSRETALISFDGQFV